MAQLQEMALEAISQGVLICDADRNVLYANEAFTRITGYGEEEMLGRNCSLLQGEGTDPVTLNALRAAVRTGQPFEGEILNYRKDGTAFWNELSISAVRDNQGRVARFIGLQRDITERKQREEERQRLSENLLMEAKRLHESQAVSGVGSWETDLSTLEVTWTDETFRIFECRPGSFTPTHEKFLSFVHPGDRTRVDEAFTRSIGQPGQFSIEHRLLFPDGRIKFVEERWQTFGATAGRLTHAVGTCQDITQRKLAETALRESEGRFATFMLNAPMAAWIVDEESRMVYANQGFADLLGRSSEELQGKHLRDLFPEEFVTQYQANNQRVLDSDHVMETMETSPRTDGSLGRFLALKFPLPTPGASRMVGGAAIDITEREEAREALAKSQDLLRIAGQIARLGGWSIDLPDHKLTWSDEVCLIHDMEPGRTPSVEEAIAFYPPACRDEVALLVKRCAEEGIPFRFELELITARQRKIWVKATGEAARDKEGRIIRVQGAAQDITEQKRAEVEISRINRALKMLSACNEALIRAENEQQLLDQICLIAVEHGGYRMAWVGYAREDETRPIQPVAHAGVEEGYLAEIDVSWSEHKPNGRGPAGRAIRDGTVFTCNDLEKEPSFAPWLEMASRRGYRSLINLPLRTGDRSFGLLGLYAAETRTPTTDELKLLQELADDLAFGIGSLRSRQEARRGQETLVLTAKRMELAAKASKVGIWDWDIATGVLHWDEQMYALYGLDGVEPAPVLETWQQQIHEEDSERTRGELAEALRPDGRPFDTAFRIIVPPENLIRHIRAQAIVLRDEENRPKRMLGTNWDVTEQVEREEMLRKNLETERALRRQAAAGERAKSEFVAVMSHEIRTPMNGVLGFAELLLHSPALSTENRDLAQTIVSSGEALLRILDDILDFSRLEAGRLAIENQVFSPKELIEGIRTLFSRKIQEKGLEFILSLDEKIPGRLVADAGRIRQILVNLIGNAIKFTEQGSVRLAARAVRAPAGNDLLEIVVEDTGPGVAPDRAEAIFEAFTQEDSSTSRRHGGTGLGLTISRRLAELMGGTLQLSSPHGPGAAFTLQLPLVAVVQVRTTEPAKLEPTPLIDADFAARHPLSILVVEDDKVNLKLMAGILRRLGYTPFSVCNGVEAVRMCEEKRIDCIFMDLQMPEMDGLEATRKIRDRERDGGIPSVFISALTANILPEDHQRCLEIGMNAYLNKPIKSPAITSVLMEAWSFRHPGKG